MYLFTLILSPIYLLHLLTYCLTLSIFHLTVSKKDYINVFCNAVMLYSGLICTFLECQQAMPIIHFIARLNIVGAFLVDPSFYFIRVCQFPMNTDLCQDLLVKCLYGPNGLPWDSITFHHFSECCSIN